MELGGIGPGSGGQDDGVTVDWVEWLHFAVYAKPGLRGSLRPVHVLVLVLVSHWLL